jgi:antirestriction protein ArdC
MTSTKRISSKRTSSKRTSTADRETAAQERIEKLEALHASLAEQVETLTTSEGWAAMLDAARVFTRYSLNNTLLLHMQMSKRGMPVQRVAGFNTWRSLGRTVLKGEKGLAIFAPCTYKTEPADDGAGAAKPSADAPGDKRRVLTGFRVAYVFGQEQTEGADLPDIRPTLLPGTAPDGLWDALSGLVRAEGYEVQRGQCSGANGFTDRLAKVVRIRDDVSESQAVKTLCHELAHVLLHCDPEYHYAGCRDTAEIEAESVSSVVCSASGMDTSAYTTAYVAGWAGGDVKKVRAAAERVVKTAGTILASLEPATSSLVMEEVAAIRPLVV